MDFMLSGVESDGQASCSGGGIQPALTFPKGRPGCWLTNKTTACLAQKRGAGGIGSAPPFFSNCSADGRDIFISGNEEQVALLSTGMLLALLKHLTVVLLLFSRQVLSDSFATPRAVAHQTPMSMGLSRQAYWSGLPFRCPGDLPDPGIEPVSPALYSLPLSCADLISMYKSYKSLYACGSWIVLSSAVGTGYIWLLWALKCKLSTTK